MSFQLSHIKMARISVPGGSPVLESVSNYFTILKFSFIEASIFGGEFTMTYISKTYKNNHNT